MEIEKETKICPICRKPIVTKIISGFGGNTEEKCECKKSQTGFGN